jgi:hypothetical protein
MTTYAYGHICKSIAAYAVIGLLLPGCVRADIKKLPKNNEHRPQIIYISTNGCIKAQSVTERAAAERKIIEAIGWQVRDIKVENVAQEQINAVKKLKYRIRTDNPLCDVMLVNSNNSSWQIDDIVWYYR